MIGRVTLKNARREIYVLALRIWVGASAALLLLAYGIVTYSDIVLPRDFSEDFQGIVIPPLILGVIFFIPFAITTAYKRWIWRDATTVWKYPAKAISEIRARSQAEIKAQREWRPPRYPWRDADKSIRILPDYIQARNAVSDEVMRTGALVDNGPGGLLENSVQERPLRWYEMTLIPFLIVGVPAAIFGFCYTISFLGWKICWA